MSCCHHSNPLSFGFGYVMLFECLDHDGKNGYLLRKSTLKKQILYCVISNYKDIHISIELQGTEKKKKKQIISKSDGRYKHQSLYGNSKGFAFQAIGIEMAQQLRKHRYYQVFAQISEPTCWEARSSSSKVTHTYTPTTNKQRDDRKTRTYIHGYVCVLVNIKYNKTTLSFQVAL